MFHKSKLPLLSTLWFLLVVMLLPACGGLSNQTFVEPISLEEIQDCNGTNFRIPHRVNAQKQGELLKFFAEEIQPILEGNVPTGANGQQLPQPDDIACISCHRVHNFSTGIGFRFAQAQRDPLDTNTQFNYNQFLCSSQINYQYAAGSRVLAKLRGKEGYDGSSISEVSLPGLHHMDNTYVIGNEQIYQAFRRWVEMEAEARTPEGVGVRAVARGGISQLCWIERPRSDFRPGGDDLTGGEDPLLICQAVDANNQLTGEAVDVTALLGLAPGYDIDNVISNKGEEGEFKLFVGLREPGTTMNVAEILLQFEEGESTSLNPFAEVPKVNRIVGAERRYIVNEEYRTGCAQYRINELGQMITRCSAARPTTYAFGRVFYEANQPIPESERVTPDYPDMSNPSQPNPNIAVLQTVSGADAYHGGEIAKNTFSIGEDGVPKIFLPSHWHRQENMTIGIQGKFAINGWENKRHSGRWLSKGFADWQYGVTTDVEAPVMGLSTALGQVAQDDLLSKLVFLNSGPLAMGVKAGGVETGGAVQIAYHERGGFTFLPDGSLPPDKALPIQNPVENFEALGMQCVEGLEGSEEAFLLHGVYGMPTLDPTGSALFVAGTEEEFDTCAADQVPQNMGIYWMTLNGDLSPVLNPLPAKPHFSNGYYVADLTWVGPAQEAVETIPEEVTDLSTATINIPNVPLYLAMKKFDPDFTQSVVDMFALNSSVFKVTKVNVLRNFMNPPSHLDTSVVSECRGCGSHPSFAGTEFATNSQTICTVDVATDGSFAIDLPARMGYSLQFLTTIDTPLGPIDVPVRQDPLRVTRPGYQEFQAPVDMEDYNNNCMSCHGAIGEFKTVKEMVLSHTGKTEFDRKQTAAMTAGPADCKTNPVGAYRDYVHDIAPVIEAKGCIACHGQTPVSFVDVNSINHSFDDVSPAGGLNFERAWANTSDPLVSSRYTHNYGQGDDCPVNTMPFEDPLDPEGDDLCIPCGTVYNGSTVSCSAHGTQAPFEPGYVLLQREATAPGVAGRTIFLGGFGAKGSTTGEFPGASGMCGSFLRTVFGDLNLNGNCTGMLGWDGQVWIHPNDKYPGMLHPVTGLPYDHRGQFTREEAQAFLDVVTQGWDYNRQIDGILAPAGSPYAGQPRWGLTPEP